MKGPFGLIVAAGLALLIVAIFFSLAPSVGGSIEEASPILGDAVTVALLNLTNVSTGHRNIGNVAVYNNSALGADNKLAYGSEYVYDSELGSITLSAASIGGWAKHINYNGTYYATMDYSRWAGTVNTDMTEGGDWFSSNQTWVTLTFLGIVAGVVIAMFMRW